jgi:ergothioneine biosynthesis protein EgtB
MIHKAMLRRQLEEVRERTLRLCTRVSDVDLCRQVHPDFSPLGWHLGHVGVTEAFWILQRCQEETSLSVAYDRLFTPTNTPKPERVHLPTRGEILTYLQAVREQVVAVLAGADFGSAHPLLKDARIFNMLLQHEEQHQETMLVILRLFAAERHDASPSPATEEGWEEREVTSGADEDMVLVPDGSFHMGSDDIARTLDNERPQHEVFVPAFLIDRYPVTNVEFLRFIRADGYHERACWSSAGWQWRDRQAVEHPLYWRKAGRDAWVEIGLDQARPLALHHPVQCVSWYEAEAYARWAGKRLPIEEEWEKAASWGGERAERRRYPWGDAEPTPLICNFDARTEDTTPVTQYPTGRSLTGCFDLLGNVWEWTGTWFQPYDGFTAFPYEGYSVPYFDQQHRVLRGGSWATRRHVLRATFRNWYQPWVREIFAGFRCAKDL